MLRPPRTRHLGICPQQPLHTHSKHADPAPRNGTRRRVYPFSPPQYHKKTIRRPLGFPIVFSGACFPRAPPGPQPHRPPHSGRWGARGARDAFAQFFLGNGQHQLDAVFLIDPGGAGVVVDGGDVGLGYSARILLIMPLPHDVVGQAAEGLGTDDLP